MILPFFLILNRLAVALWVLSLGIKLFLSNNHEHLTALSGQRLVNDDRVAETRYIFIKNLNGEGSVGLFPSAEHEFNSDFMPLLEKFQGLIDPHIKIVHSDLQR